MPEKRVDTAPETVYDSREQEWIAEVFSEMLSQVTADGGRKRQRAEKPPWWQDPTHIAGIFSHLARYFRGENQDPDSGQHPFVHLAWRALAKAYQDTYGQVDPRDRRR